MAQEYRALTPSTLPSYLTTISEVTTVLGGDPNTWTVNPYQKFSTTAPPLPSNQLKIINRPFAIK